MNHTAPMFNYHGDFENNWQSNAVVAKSVKGHITISRELTEI